MPITHERGYLIPAWGEQYVKCAEHLKASILDYHPDANVTIVTELPHGNQGGWANDWQVFGLSPYRQTIKLEADMLCTGPVDHWWTLFENRDVVISQGARDFYNQTTSARQYRKIFDANNLPDVYNAITYWRVSQQAQEFFFLVRDIFINWQEYKKLLKFPEETPSTDVVYAIAAVLIGVEKVTLPLGLGPNIVHMKKYIIPISTDKWTQELTWEHTKPGLRINTIAQQGFVHYHYKEWLND